jgi:hypothetical protein
MTPATANLVVARQHRLIIIAAIRRPAVGEMTVGHHPHHVTPVGTRLPTAGVMTAGRHRHHLALAGTTINAMMIDVAAMVEIVVSPLRGIFDAATRFRKVHLVLVDVTSVSVHRRHVETAVESGSGIVIRTAHVLVLVIMTAEEMFRGKDTGIAGVETNDHVMDHLLIVSTLFRLCDMTIVKVPISRLILPCHDLRLRDLWSRQLVSALATGQQPAIKHYPHMTTMDDDVRYESIY